MLDRLCLDDDAPFAREVERRLSFRLGLAPASHQVGQGVRHLVRAEGLQAGDLHLVGFRAVESLGEARQGEVEGGEALGPLPKNTSIMSTPAASMSASRAPVPASVWLMWMPSRFARV